MVKLDCWNLGFADNKEYSKTEYISSFASIFPIENPKYVLIISLEAPSYDKRWGESAVPCAKNIIEEIIFYDKELKLRKHIMIELNKILKELFTTEILIPD